MLRRRLHCHLHSKLFILTFTLFALSSSQRCGEAIYFSMTGGDASDPVMTVPNSPGLCRGTFRLVLQGTFRTRTHPKDYDGCRALSRALLGNYLMSKRIAAHDGSG